jgi:ParB family chromosome partitioning protein
LREPTDDERAEQARIDERNGELESALDAAFENDEPADELESEYEANERRSDEIRQGREVVDDALIAQAGVVVYIDDSGDAAIERGLVKQADLQAVKAMAASGSGQMGGVEATGRRQKEPGALSDALTRRLSIERTSALRAALGEAPRVAFVALVHALILQEFAPWKKSAVSVDVRSAATGIGEGEPVGETKRKERAERLRSALPENPDDYWMWTLEQSDGVLMMYLAHCVAEGTDAVLNRSGETKTSAGAPISASHELARALDFDMADWWSATPESYLGAVSKPLIVEAVKEATGDADGAGRLEKMKKGEAVAAAAAALAGTRWLPPALRTL